MSRIGAARRRLICFGQRLIAERQQRGLDLLLLNSGLAKASLVEAQQQARVQINLTYSHEWDETRSVFARFNRDQLGTQFAQSRQGIHVQVMVQRGQVGTHVVDVERDVYQPFSEE